jgi:hypothetical protein
MVNLWSLNMNCCEAVVHVAPLAALVKLRVLYSVAAAELMIWRHWI